MHINNRQEFEDACARLEILWSARPGDPDFEERAALVTAIMDYEKDTYMPLPTPEETARFRKEQEAMRPARTKLFLDTEFTGLHQNTTLISLALVADTGDEFYAEFTDYDAHQVDPWIQDNVLTNLILAYHPVGSDVSNPEGHHHIKGPTAFVAESLMEWLRRFGQAEIWVDVGAYDWVIFCQLFGGAQKLPKNIFYIPYDVATLFRVVGIDPDVRRDAFAAVNGWHDALPQHNALHDAQVLRECWRIVSNAAIASIKKGEKLRLDL